jgi:predicted dehydrogenase
MTENVEQAERLTQEAETNGLVVLVGHIERFNPAYMELKHVVERMNTLAINFRRLSAYEHSNDDADVVLDLMTHDIDLALDLIGTRPTTVNANGLTAVSGVADHAVACLGFVSGPLVTITASRVTEEKVRSIEVTALEAYAEADLLRKSVSVYRMTTGEYLNHSQQGVRYRQESIVERIYVPASEPLFLELEHFVDCILQSRSPLVPARAGLETLRVAARVRDAINTSLIDLRSAFEPAQRSVQAST